MLKFALLTVALMSSFESKQHENIFVIFETPTLCSMDWLFFCVEMPTGIVQLASCNWHYQAEFSNCNKKHLDFLLFFLSKIKFSILAEVNLKSSLCNRKYKFK